MQIGFVGLGKMGANMVHRLRRDGDHAVVAYDPNLDARTSVEAFGATTAPSIDELIAKLDKPRGVWIMVPSGRITDDTVAALQSLLEQGDTIIDGGNSNYHDSIARATSSAQRGIGYIDAGTSGGVWGLEVGYCLMAGGEKETVDHWRPIFTTLAPPDGFLHVGPSGAGHFVKMVHNGIEYGMLQAYAEGFAIMQAKQDFGELGLHAIAHLWNQGSVVRSWLLELAERAFARDPQLDQLRGWVDDSGEGRWTLEDAMALSVPAPVLAMSLIARYQSRLPDGFGNKVIAALRNEFGGHAVKAEAGTSPSS
jgi:6-phosphogluconate dehydrogenase